MELVNTLVNKITGWIDKLFGFADFYSSRYSFYIVIGFLGLVAAKVFNLKIKLGK